MTNLNEQIQELLEQNTLAIKQLQESKAKESAQTKQQKTKGRSTCIDDVNYCLGTLGEVNEVRFDCGEYKRTLLDNNNAFIDIESAKMEAKRNKLIGKLREVCNQYEACDWSDERQLKYSLGWWYSDNKVDIWIHSNTQITPLPHCTNRQALQDFTNSLSSEDLKLLVCGVE